MKKPKVLFSPVFMLFLWIGLCLLQACSVDKERSKTADDWVDTVPPVVVDVTPGDEETLAANTPDIVVTFDEPMKISTITVNTNDTNCSGAVQLSSDEFLSCQKFSALPKVANNENRILTFSLADKFEWNKAYKLKVTSSAQSEGGTGLAKEYVMNQGFKLAPAVLEITNNSNSGTITSAPDGIVCGSDCREEYEYETSLTLSSTTSFAGSSHFKWGDLWNGCDTLSIGTCTVSMTTDKTILISPGSSFEDVVVDSSTDLMWQREDDNIKRSWSAGTIYCNDSTLGGYTNWRLPSIDELQGIINTNSSPSIDIIAFPNTNSSYYWSSTPNSDSTSLAWYALFSSGVVYYRSKIETHYVRCVRS